MSDGVTDSMRSRVPYCHNCATYHWPYEKCDEQLILQRVNDELPDTDEQDYDDAMHGRR